MNKKWLVGLSSLIVIGATTVAFGDSALKVIVDGDRINSDLSASDIRSVQELATDLGAFVAYDRESDRLRIEQPEVNVTILEGIQQVRKNIVLSNPVQGFMEKDIPRSFGVFVEVDDAPEAKNLFVKVALIAPNGRVVESTKDRVFSTKVNKGFYFSQPFVSTKLDQLGTYKVQVVMKQEKNGQEVVVGENSFTVGR